MRQEFETTLIAQDIIVRQNGEDDKNIEENAGLWFPLIRIKDTVFHMDKISSLNYSVGQSLLPTITVTIDDNDKAFLEEGFPNIDDLITVRISNNSDTEHLPMKLDFMIVDVSGSESSRFTTISAVQHVPKLHLDNNVGWYDSLFNITKTIAQECGLGFVTNIQDSTDISNWICPNDYLSYLKYIKERMQISNDDSCHIFIDAFNNLNVISMKNAFENRTQIQLLTNPVSGELYEDTVDILLSNKVYRENIDTHVQVNQWSPITNYGMGYLKTKSEVEYLQKNNERHMDSSNDIFTVTNINAIEGSGDKIFSQFVDGETVFGDILRAKKKNKRLQSIYKQGTYVKATLDYYIADIFPFMYINSEFYNKGRNSVIKSQDDGVDINALEKQDSEYVSHASELNTSFSGDYLVVECNYSFIKTNAKGNKIKHSLKMMQL